MMHHKTFKFVPGLVLAGAVGAMALGSGGCSAASTIAGAAQGCNEFSGGASAVASLSIDANTKAFVTAASELVQVSATLEGDVLTACVGIDTDLKVTDTWTAKGPDGGGSLDAEVTEACNQASAAISAGLSGDAGAQAACQLSIAGGQCTVKADAQISCEGSCTGSGSCQPGTVQARCSPGELTGQCSGTCNAMATCEGSASVQANCQGSCSAECTGTCTPPTAGSVDCTGTCGGKCTGTCDGSTASGTACAGTCSGKCDAACTFKAGSPGHCSGSCKGTCNGNCTLDANAMVSCGGSVNCKGGCSVAYTAPECEAKLTPPSCNVDANCEASCQSQAEFQATCSPPSVTLNCDASASAGVTAIVTTVQKNFPALILAAKTQGQLALDAAQATVKAGANVVANVGSLGGKAIACAQAAATASVSASASVNVSVMASASASASTGG